jgi:ABC-type molybdate transport system permease subunit
MLKAIIVIFLISVYIASIVDVARGNKQKIRALPKSVWLLVVIVLPVLGGCLWVVFGRDEPLVMGRNKKYQIPGPEDDPDFLRKL